MAYVMQIAGIIARSRGPRKILPLFLLGTAAFGVAPQTVCDRIVLTDSPGISFSRSELSLMCSSPDVEGWGNVTDTQALYYLKNFLSVHGYHDVKSERKGNQIFVTLGSRERVKKFVVLDAPPAFKPQRMRRVLRKYGAQLLHLAAKSFSDAITCRLLEVSS